MPQTWSLTSAVPLTVPFTLTALPRHGAYHYCPSSERTSSFLPLYTSVTCLAHVHRHRLSLPAVRPTRGPSSQPQSTSPHSVVSYPTSLGAASSRLGAIACAASPAWGTSPITNKSAHLHPLHQHVLAPPRRAQPPRARTPRPRTAQVAAPARHGQRRHG